MARHHEELAGAVHVEGREALLDVADELVGDLRERQLLDVHLGLLHEVQEQVERAVEGVERDAEVSHGGLAGVRGARSGARRPPPGRGSGRGGRSPQQDEEDHRADRVHAAQAIAARRGSRPPTIVPPSSGGERDQVEHAEHHVHRHQLPEDLVAQARPRPEARREGQRDRGDDREDEVARRPGERDRRGAEEGVAEPEGLVRDRLRPADRQLVRQLIEDDQRQGDRADQVEVRDGVQGDPPEAYPVSSPQPARDEGVRALVRAESAARKTPYETSRAVQSTASVAYRPPPGDRAPFPGRQPPRDRPTIEGLRGPRCPHALPGDSPARPPDPRRRRGAAVRDGRRRPTDRRDAHVRPRRRRVEVVPRARRDGCPPAAPGRHRPGDRDRPAQRHRRSPCAGTRDP